MWVKWKWIMQTQKRRWQTRREKSVMASSSVWLFCLCSALTFSTTTTTKKLDGLRVLPAEEHCHWRNVTDIATYVQKKNNDNKKGSRTRALPNAKQSALPWYLNFPPAKTTTTTKRELLYNRVRYSSTYTWQELKGASLKAQVIIEEKLFFFYVCVCVYVWMIAEWMQAEGNVYTTALFCFLIAYTQTTALPVYSGASIDVPSHATGESLCRCTGY